MHPFLTWILCYALPVLAGVSIAYRLKRKEARIFVIHVGLTLSIVLLSAVGVRLAWSFSLWFVILTGATILAAIWMLGMRDGFLYLVSCIVQEACILLAGVLLLPLTGPWFAAFATALVFALAHRMNERKWWLRFLIIGGWGFCSVLLYAWFREPLLNVSLHILGGGILIYYGVLFKNRKEEGMVTER